MDRIDGRKGPGGRGGGGGGQGLIHIGNWALVFGLFLFVFVWFAAQAAGLNALWSIPAAMIGVPLVAILPRLLRLPGSGRRIEHPIRYFVLLGAVVFAGLGIWFTISEGDLPVLRGAVMFGAIGGVLGLVPGVLLRVWRAIRS